MQYNPGQKISRSFFGNNTSKAQVSDYKPKIGDIEKYLEPEMELRKLRALGFHYEGSNTLVWKTLGKTIRYKRVSITRCRITE